MQLSSKTFDMNEVLDAVTAMAFQLSPEKIQAIASRVRRTNANNITALLSGMVGAPASGVLDQLIKTWKASTVSADELASMLLAASHALTKANSEQSTELVWTGPTTPFVSARRTEQALLQVINSANATLFITSFVAYDISSIISALNSAIERGVRVSMLLESSLDHGGSISIDTIGKMRLLVPLAHLYAWRDKSNEFIDGKVHAKVAVADGKMCFITSANLTGYAMEKNMETGVLISGGVAAQLNNHLSSLIDTKVITRM